MTEFTGGDCFPCTVEEHCKGYRFRKRLYVGTTDARLLRMKSQFLYVLINTLYIYIIYIFNIYVYIKISHEDLILQ